MINIIKYIYIYVITIILFCLDINKNTDKYMQHTLLFDKMINKEVWLIYSNYKKYKSIRFSRKFLSLTQYDKKRKNNVVYKKKCKVISKFKRIKRKILIAVHSHISLFYQRHVFRKIYKYYKNIQLLFFVGLDYNQSINIMAYKEMNLYKDIVLFNFYSSYYNLQYFTYNFLIWVKAYKYLYDIIIKQDTDTFLNLNLLVL